MKLLFFGTYHSTHPIYGLTDTKYFEQVGLALDVYSNYDEFLLAGDFNVKEEENCLRDFLFHYNAKNLVKGKPVLKVLKTQNVLIFFSPTPIKIFKIQLQWLLAYLISTKWQ